ncbi:Uncharacterised protein [Mycobacteroides abscessus subsp. abscessus]|nr:Uncharacterised protein [Mycobacteroides abscessus subsp. abscessus]
MVDPGIHFLDQVPFFPKAYRFCLLLQVAVLPSRHLMLIDLRMWRLHSGLKILVVFPDIFPIVGQLLQCFNIHFRLAFLS